MTTFHTRMMPAELHRVFYAGLGRPGCLIRWAYSDPFRYDTIERQVGYKISAIGSALDKMLTYRAAQLSAQIDARSQIRQHLNNLK